MTFYTYTELQRHFVIYCINTECINTVQKCVFMYAFIFQKQYKVITDNQ